MIKNKQNLLSMKVFLFNKYNCNYTNKNENLLNY